MAQTTRPAPPQQKPKSGGGTILDTIDELRGGGAGGSGTEVPGGGHASVPAPDPGSEIGNLAQYGSADPLDVLMHKTAEGYAAPSGTDDKAASPTFLERGFHAAPEAMSFIKSLFGGEAGLMSSAVTGAVGEAAQASARGEVPDPMAITGRAALNAAPSAVGGAAKLIPKAGEKSVMASMAGGRTVDAAGNKLGIKRLRELADIAVREGASMSEAGIAKLKQVQTDLVKAAVPLAAGSKPERALLDRAHAIQSIIPELEELVDASARRGFSIPRMLAGSGLGGYIAALTGMNPVVGAGVGLLPAVAEASAPTKLKIGEMAAGGMSRGAAGAVEPLIRALLTAYQAGPGTEAVVRRRHAAEPQ